MTFIGRIKQNSPVWRLWRNHARTGGVIQGVPFAWEPGNVYRTLPLTTDQIDVLKTHESVILEVVSTDVPEPIPVAEVGAPVAAPLKPVYVNSTRPLGKR